jgi:hypothetical protein
MKNRNYWSGFCFQSNNNPNPLTNPNPVTNPIMHPNTFTVPNQTTNQVGNPNPILVTNEDPVINGPWKSSSEF